MKITADKKLPFKLRFFDSKHDPLFIGISLVVLIVLSLAAFGFFKNFSLQKLTDISQVDSSLSKNLQSHSEAFSRLQSAEASVSALKANNIDSSEAEVGLENLKNLFAKQTYSDMLLVSEDVFAKSSELQNSDDSKYASYSASLINLEIKFEDYKKRGVNVATVSADIATASADLEKKDYPKVEESVGRINQILDKLLKIKVDADKKALVSVPVSAPVAAQSVGGVTYERKIVNTARGAILSDILTVDMNRVKVKTFTSSENDCSADCPLKPLQSYVAENGGIAGINGTYFCPADYAQCASTKNSFNFLVFDYRSKKYLNSDQNKFSVNPLISFYNDGAHYYTQALGYGRDTSANGVISNYPTLVHNGGISAADGGAKGVRCGIGYRDKTLWAVCARSATIAELAYVYQSLGANYALNLDGGGSAAIYFNGYKIGPGRQLPNAVVFTN